MTNHNRHRFPLRILAVGAILCALIGHSMPAAAQKTSLPASTLTASTDKTVIKGQLQMAARLGRKALAGFQASPREDSVPLDEDTLQAARDTYLLLRVALHGMDQRKSIQKFPDPVEELAYKRVTEAWNLSRFPVDTIRGAPARDYYLSESIATLGRAVQLVDQVLVLL